MKLWTVIGVVLVGVFAPMDLFVLASLAQALTGDRTYVAELLIFLCIVYSVLTLVGWWLLWPTLRPTLTPTRTRLDVFPKD